MLAKIFTGSFLHTESVDAVEALVDTSIGVDSDGRILFVHQGSAEDALISNTDTYDFEDEATTAHIEIIEAGEGQFFVPGFFDTHVHAPQLPNSGIFGEETLLDWLDTYTFPLEATYKDTQRAAEVYQRLVERSLANGTTMASYFGTIHVDATALLAQIALEKGQRALVGRVCMERLAPDNLLDLPRTGNKLDAEFVDKIQALDATGDTIKPILTPRFAPSCVFETLLEQGRMAKERGLPIQTHVDENLDEIELVAEFFPEYSSYMEVYEKAGLLKHDTILAHSIHVKDDELELVVKAGSGIAHCPISNASLSSGICPVKKYLSKGVHVGLGSDVAGGYTLSILENIRQALMQSRLLAQRTGDDFNKLTVANALFLATLGGAQVANVADRLGSFSVGKCWDAQLIDVNAEGSQIDIFQWSVPEDPQEKMKFLTKKWVYTGDDRNTIKVWVNGRIVVDKVKD